jgi:S1-C subfamily serine protease
MGVVLAVLVMLGGAEWTLVVRDAAKQVPRLEMQAPGADKPGTCSGIVINAELGFILTAAHCVDTEKVAVTVNGRHAEVVRSNRLLDLAVLKTDVKDEKTIYLADADAPVGEEVSVCGYAFGFTKIVCQFGHVAQLENGETKSTLLNIDLIFGDSGGAAINARGELIGVNSFIYSQGPAHLAGIVPVDTIRAFAKPFLPRKP